MLEIEISSLMRFVANREAGRHVLLESVSSTVETIPPRSMTPWPMEQEGVYPERSGANRCLRLAALFDLREDMFV